MWFMCMYTTSCYDWWGAHVPVGHTACPRWGEGFVFGGREHEAAGTLTQALGISLHLGLRNTHTHTVVLSLIMRGCWPKMRVLLVLSGPLFMEPPLGMRSLPRV